MKRLAHAFMLAGLLSMLGSTGAAASGPAGSPLPGYPRFRGVVLVHNGSAASLAEERKIQRALSAAGAEGAPQAPSPLLSGHPEPDCAPYLKKEEGEYPGADLCWWGGKVTGGNTVHLIFWEGPGTEHKFPIGYREAIEEYFERVADSSRTFSNVYAVSGQYGDAFEPSGTGLYNVSFSKAEGAYLDKALPLPPSGSLTTECEDPAAPAGEPCVTDKDLRAEIEAASAAEKLKGHNWEIEGPDALKQLYFVLTPPKVGGCFYDKEEAETNGVNDCAFETYCAYHSSFEETKKEVPPEYISLPDTGTVEGCDSFEYPNSPPGVDAVLDSASHEHIETITDPLGNGWFDLIGQEIADKCLPPENFEIYGGALGPSTAEGGKAASEGPNGEIIPGNLYNQIIGEAPGEGHYWLQTEWSNSATFGEGRCVQRMLHAEIALEPGPNATVPETLSGAYSGEAADRAVYWVWTFGDGEANGEEYEGQIGTSKPTVEHTYALPGTYLVRLTAYDTYGNSGTREHLITVGEAPPAAGPTPTPAAPAPATNTVTVTTPPPPALKYSVAQMAKLLGLRGNGGKLSGNGPFVLGHAECPPACTITLKLYARVTRVVHKHRITSLVLIGSAQDRGKPRGAVFVKYSPIGELLLSLNAKGRALLHKIHRASARLVVTVEGQEGGVWTIERSLTLKR